MRRCARVCSNLAGRSFFSVALQMQVKTDIVTELLTEPLMVELHRMEDEQAVLSAAFAMPTTCFWDCFTW